MPVIRASNAQLRQYHYTKLCNRAMRDPKLSGMEKAVLAYAMTHSDSWTLQARVVARDFKESKSTIYRAMAGLVQKGYAKHVGGVFTIYEVPPSPKTAQVPPVPKTGP